MVAARKVVLEQNTVERVFERDARFRRESNVDHKHLSTTATTFMNMSKK